MKHVGWIGLAAGVLLAWSFATVPARAQVPEASPKDKLAELRREVSKLSFDVLRAKAEGAELEDEERVLTTSRERGAETESRPLSAEGNFWESVLKNTISISNSAQTKAEVVNKLEKLHESIEENEGPLARDAWLAAMQRSDQFHQAEAARKAQIGNGSRSTGELIAWGTLAVLGGTLLTIHEVRGRLRWRLRALGSRPSLIVIAIAVPLAAAFGAAPDAEDSVNPPAPAGAASGSAADAAAELEHRREILKKQLDEQRQANNAARQRLALRLEEVRQSRAAHVLKPMNPYQGRLFSRAEQLEADVQEQFRKVRIAARITANAAEEAEKLDDEVTKNSLSLNSSIQSSRRVALQDSLIRLATCVLLLFAAVVPLTFVRRRRRRQLKEESRKCPRCLNMDTLDFDTTATQEDDGRQAKFRKKICSACDYEIRENYIQQNRLCFPTVGIRASGKTHWMGMSYDMIKNANIPVASSIRKIPSREDARFDELVRRLLYEGGKLDPTLYSLPYPLTFHVLDADPLGPNKSMVNLFDFSGEMRNFDIDQNEFRRRALLCEGFTLFLDPTQVSKGSDATIEDQIQTLAQFADEMHAIRGLASETPVDLPIAICVSKMDLLVNKSPMGTQAIDLVTALRGTLTRKVDLALIHERSQLCARAMPLMFPGWNIERTLKENFGGRYMFFPMSAVGLEDFELGIENLSDRTITPFGMIEPFLWLLHMHGYCVLH